jgi:hypothetical protein
MKLTYLVLFVDGYVHSPFDTLSGTIRIGYNDLLSRVKKLIVTHLELFHLTDLTRLDST